jgi:hypothetical protein
LLPEPSSLLGKSVIVIGIVTSIENL